MEEQGYIPTVIVDACVLVKDVVSFALYDLHAAGMIEIFWTPEIEAEYIEHRARLRAESMGLVPKTADYIWASTRIEVIKKHLIKNSTPPDWVFEETIGDLVTQEKYLCLQNMKDQGDVHVAAAAGYLAELAGRAVILVSDNIVDLPQHLLKPLNVVVMHPGVLLEFLYNIDPVAISNSLLKTSKDFKNPLIPPEKMLLSIESRNQFHNPELAQKLAIHWNIASSESDGERVKLGTLLKEVGASVGGVNLGILGDKTSSGGPISFE